MGLFLNVPYKEKDEARALGARWNPEVKRWYVDVPQEEYIKFAKWILRDTDDAIIATEYIFIIEGQRTCWKCGRSTKVIGLGVGEFIHIFDAGNGPEYEGPEDYADSSEELHLAWTACEEDIPPKLRKYLMETYSVKTGYSQTIGENCFANHCDHCGALQGNYYVFEEVDSPLTLLVEGDELVEQASKLKIFGIPIADDLQLYWEVEFGSNDYAYFEYGQFEELVLSSDPESDYVSYEELYGDL